MKSVTDTDTTVNCKFEGGPCDGREYRPEGSPSGVVLVPVASGVPLCTNEAAEHPHRLRIVYARYRRAGRDRLVFEGWECGSPVTPCFASRGD